MAILRPIASRSSGAWTINNAASIHAALADPSDVGNVEIDNISIVGDERIVVQMSPGGIPPEADGISIFARAEHTGQPQDTVNIQLITWDGDPDEGGRPAWVISSIGVPRNAATRADVLNKPQQRNLRNINDLWMELIVINQTGNAGLVLYFLEIEVGDDPVGTWNDDVSLVPENTLVHLRMSDGRAWQGKCIGGEWYDASNDPIEFGFMEYGPFAHRSVSGWKAI